MFQSFAAPSTNKSDTSKRLTDLRKKMATGGIDWFLVPHADEHQNEYLPARAERLAWITGFSGSAGFAMIGLKKAFLFVDGRYTAQVREQADMSLFEICDLVASPPSGFAGKKIKSGEAIGFDPWLITIAQKKDWQKTAVKCGAELKAVENLIDAIWHDQPPAPDGKAWLHPVQFAGRSAEEKLRELQAHLEKEDADACLLTDPASIAWTFNLRGSDVAHNPLVLVYALIRVKGKPTLFVDARKFSGDDQKALNALADVAEPGALMATLKNLPGKTGFLCDPNLVASAIGDALDAGGLDLTEQRDPVVLLRAIKNETELQGARNAQLRDGVAVTRFLCWLDGQPSGTVTEIDAAKKLEDCRRETARAMGSRLEEISFDTISGAGANGAIVHYRVTEATNSIIEDNSLYLVDSGGQYLDGTTDITRTIAIGTPPTRAITDNTLVLKGHIAIATARFPAGTRGVDLDALARISLWKSGKDFAHGTGHGIGSYLNVHEGPQSISRRGMEAFKSGMIISNEPGYYREGEYGIRIENLVIVNEAGNIRGGDKPMLGFETITLCPIDLRLVDPAMLTADEIAWLNQYHARVCAELKPHLNGQEAKWLETATRRL